VNLPHGEALLFAKEILEKNNDAVKVRCEFSMLPTLAMFVEAAAQCSAAFNSDSAHSIKIAFLTKANDVKLLKEIESLHFFFVLKKKVEVGQYKKFFFDAYDENTGSKIVSGKFTLFIQE
jgi:hypothetical protein